MASTTSSVGAVCDSPFPWNGFCVLSFEALGRLGLLAANPHTCRFLFAIFTWCLALGAV